MIIKEIRPKGNILNTKLGKIKKDIDLIESLSIKDCSKLVGIVVKYNEINKLFESDVEYNKKDLVKLIEGQHDYDADSNQNYNDTLFELSMAVRFLQVEKGAPRKVNLLTDCDLIVNNELAVECKYIHSKSNLVKNISKAKKQVETRVCNNEAEFGYIALDLSSVIPLIELNNFFNFTYSRFLKNYENFYEKNIVDDVVRHLLLDRNFIKIISSYISHEVESILYGELGVKYDLGENVKAIIFQSFNTFCIEYENKIYPISIRGMSYFINHKLSKNETIEIQKNIHKLAVGI